MENEVRILLVENDMDVVRELTEKLEEMNYDVYNVAKGEKAIKIYKRIDPTFIIMDIDLDGEIDGIETIKRLQKIKEVPFVFHTQFEERFDEALSTNPHQWFDKQGNLKQILKNVRLALKNSKTSFMSMSGKEKLIDIVLYDKSIIFVPKNDIVAIELVNSEVCYLHTYSNIDEVRDSRIIDMSVRGVMKKINIPSIHKIQDFLAINFHYPYVKGLGKDGISLLIDEKYLKLESPENKTLNISRRLRPKIAELLKIRK